MKIKTGILGVLLISGNVYAEQTLPAATEAVNQDATPVVEQSGFSKGSVMRAEFTTSISEREPTNTVQSLTNDVGQVMFFTELRDMNGQTALHRWEHNGKVVAEIEFNVRGPRWRIWSSKNLSPDKTGDWNVSVINGAGEVISSKTLNYTMASNAAETPAAIDVNEMEKTESIK